MRKIERLYVNSMREIVFVRGEVCVRKREKGCALTV